MAGKNGKRKPRKKSPKDKQQNPKASPATPPLEPTVVKQSDPQIKDGNANQKHDRDVPPSRPAWAVNWKWLFGAIAAVAAIIGTWIAYMQWSTARKSMEMDQRPWFRLEAIPLREVQAGKPFAFEIKVTNVGKAIGTLIGQCTLTVPLFQSKDVNSEYGRFIDIHGTRQIELTEKSLQVAEEGVAGYGIEHIAVPGETITFQPGGQHPLIPEVIPLIKSGGIIVVVLVVVEYHDAGGVRHRTRTCFVYDAKKRTCFNYNKYNYMK